MTNLDKIADALVKSVGPTDEDRQKFGKTFLGTLLGQATVLVGTLAVYFVFLVFFNRFVIKDLEDLRTSFGDILFWIALTGPLVVILLFSILPLFWRTLRERRMKAAIISGGPQFKGGYFRLYPYGETDRDAFTRLDGADIKCENWLRSTKAPLLYMSGASGVGKSSLLAAHVLPKLRSAGWAVVEARLFGDPMADLRAVVLKADGLFPRRPAADLPFRDLLEKAAETRKKGTLAPVLFVVDQFEEFLILHGEKQRADFADFLNSFVNNPIEGVRFLLVFRSDYRPLVFKLELPPLVAKENWQELAPYDRGEATSFLQGGGRELSSEALDALFRGLDRIEEARGLYRLITLNMVGLVLERMGRTVEGDPARLIQRYLTDCLTASPSRDFVKPLLATMITDAGTKEPRSERELSQLTRLEPWQVKATLTDLGGQGLIRRLEGAMPVWEIAHDFLARAIGQLIGRLKPSLLQRARPIVAPIVLLGWIALAILALPYWQTLQERHTEAVLRNLGAAFRAGQLGGTYIFFEGLDDTKLSHARNYLGRLKGLVGLHFSEPRITSLEPLTGLTNLRALTLTDATAITSLEPLKELTNLDQLILTRATGITNLEPLKGLTHLNQLDLTGLTGITNLDPLKGLPNLSVLLLTDAAGITNLDPLKGLTKLNKLDLGGLPGVTNLEPLKGLTNLRALLLTGPIGITNLEPLKGLTNLRELDLSDATGITNLEPLKELRNLHQLSLFRLTGVTNLEPLKVLTNLQDLNLTEVTGVTNLEPLKGLTNLGTLSLSRATGVTNLEPLKGLTKLRELDLTGIPGVTSLTPLKGLTNLNKLVLTDVERMTTLEPLKELTNFDHLHVWGATGITNLEPLKDLTNLNQLALTGLTGVTNLEPLKGLTKLNQLALFDITGVTSLDPLKELTNLNGLGVTGATGVPNLEPLKGLTNISDLRMRGLTQITSLEPLEGLTKLQRLFLTDVVRITNLEPLNRLTNLSEIWFTGATGVTGLEPVKGLRNLSLLMLADVPGITSLEPLKGLMKLRFLMLSGATGLTTLEPLKGATSFSYLGLAGASEITSLEPLRGLTNLSYLALAGAAGITSLEPLRGLTNLWASVSLAKTASRAWSRSRGR